MAKQRHSAMEVFRDEANMSDNAIFFVRLCHVLSFLWLCLVSTVIHAGEPVVARYVRITLPGDGRVLSLAEVQVYSGEKLVSMEGTATQVSTFRNASAAKAIDGQTSGDFFGGSVSSTEPGKFVWWQLDLGADQAITKIVIYNRTDCCGERINPAQISLANNSRKTVWRTAIESTRARYELEVNLATSNLSGGARNLLRNTAFQATTVPLLPDYWDLHHAAAFEFRNLHNHYGIDPSVPGPFPGVRVLKVINSAANFPYLILSSTNIEADLRAENYTYSVYVKSDRDAVIGVAQGEKGGPVVRRVSTNWARYAFTFKKNGAVLDVRPYMYFPTKATYYVAAPQLEEGVEATQFDARYVGNSQPLLGGVTRKFKEWVHSKIRRQLKNGMLAQPFRAIAEYDYYTTQDAARIELSSTYTEDVNADMACVAATDSLNVFFKKSIQLRPRSAIYVKVPIKNLLPGKYRCAIKVTERRGKMGASVVEIQKRIPHPLEVRVNGIGRFLAVNNAPFSITGIAVRAGSVPDWYFADLRAHGVNTVFYSREPDSNYEYDVRNIVSVVTAAAKHDLKVVVGLSSAGAKPVDWRRKLTAFLTLIDRLDQYPQIIGWYPLDEPSAHTWQDGEVMEIYRAVKQRDPYRAVFINWAYDGVPEHVGEQPRGSLSATDVYGTDYYPFTGSTQDLSGFSDTTIRAALTARLYGKPSFSWLQLFGGGPAWREPTGPELRYMAYVNFIYGSMIGYWDTKSNSAETWDLVKVINAEGNVLANELFFNEDAIQVTPPAVDVPFLYTVWKKDEKHYVIVLNLDSVSRRLLFGVLPFSTRGVPPSVVRSMFEGREVKLVNGGIDEWFAPYEGKVYEMMASGRGD